MLPGRRGGSRCRNGWLVILGRRPRTAGMGSDMCKWRGSLARPVPYGAVPSPTVQEGPSGSMSGSRRDAPRSGPVPVESSMRLAIFSDVHGQVARLSACLDSIARVGADQLWWRRQSQHGRERPVELIGGWQLPLGGGLLLAAPDGVAFFNQSVASRLASFSAFSHCWISAGPCCCSIGSHAPFVTKPHVWGWYPTVATARSP